MNHINRTQFLLAFIMGAMLSLLGCSQQPTSNGQQPPNIVYVMLDELGYYEPSFMDNQYLRTPNIDRMAREGMQFTQALAGAPVCAPSRSVFLTGQHLGHTTVRRNPGGVALRADDVTVGEVLKKAGYATGGFGKWGCGDRGTTGVPEKHGFDIFFGYYHQVHPHTFYPNYLLRNSEKIPQPGNTGAFTGQSFSQYPIFDETIKFIRENKDRPFFCYAPWTPPHGRWEGYPEDDPSWALYKDKPWPREAKIYAAMVNLVDREIGDILTLLKELELDDNTIVFVSGDNGGAPRFGDEAHPNGLFNSNGGVFRGRKGDLYEGGLRIPMVVRWPGKIKPGQTSDHLWYFADVMPTLAELAGVAPTENIDGISILPTLLGEEAAGRKQENHDYLYWEYMEGVAVRMDNWKLVRPPRNRRPKDWKQGSWELYDLSTDIGENNNVAAAHPDIVKKMVAYAEAAHTDVVEGDWIPGGEELGFKGHESK